MKAERIAIVKTGWSEAYRGEPVSGDFAFIEENEEGHERFNFLSGPDDRFYGYLPPIGRNYATPQPRERDGWLVVFVAKRRRAPGLFIVGWYEDARFEPTYVQRPEYSLGEPFELDEKGDPFIYALSAPRAFLVPEPLRVEKLETTRIKRTPIAYLRGHGRADAWREQLAREVEQQLRRLRDEAERQGFSMPRRGGGWISLDPEHRKAVEDASMAAAEQELTRLGYKVQPVHLENRGYDLLATRRKEPKELHVEVKGTSGSVRHFLMSSREHDYMQDERWRLAMVRESLSPDPKVELLDRKQTLKTFELGPFAWQGRERS